MLMICICIKFIKMNTQNHSVLLHRLSHTIDASNKTNTHFDSFYSETIKLPTLHAINKSVKYNDISFATSRRLDKLRKQPDQPDNIEQMAAHQSFMTVRKKYDDMKKIKQEHGHSIDLLETEKQKYLTQKKKFVRQKNQGEKKVAGLANSLINIKLHLEQTDIERKIMINMVSRLKSDKIIYDLRKNNYQKELTRFQKMRQIIIKESANKKEEGDNTKQVYSKLIDHLSAEKIERQLHINSLSTMIDQKSSLLQNAEIRNSEMKEISQATLQDKDPKEKNWYKIYLCHQLVGRLLRDKMAREMTKFNAVQMAYKNIKTATGVSHTEELVTKFLSKEEAYGQLLGKIAENQKHIQQLKAEKSELNSERKKLKAEKDNLNLNKRQVKNVSKQQNDFQVMSEIALRQSMNMNRLSSWIVKNSRKLNISDSQSQNSSFDNLKNICMRVFSKIQEALQETKDIQLEQFERGIIENHNNIRIKIEEQTSDHRNHTSPQNDEEEFMNKQHQQIIKNNEKYMKDLKKKYEEIKLMQLEQEPKKKQIIIEKAKISPVEQN